jgi:hypothetical protein
MVGSTSSSHSNTTFGATDDIIYHSGKDAVGGAVVASNTWRSRVYASAVDGPSPDANKVYTQEKYCEWIPVGNMQCSIPALGATVPDGSVFVIDYVDSAVLSFASAGATIILVNNATTGNALNMQSDPAVFKTAWWLGQPTDNNMGTVVYDDFNTNVAPGMAPDGWADEGWFNLIQGGKNWMVEGLDQLANSTDGVEVLVRSIDLITFSRHGARFSAEIYTRGCHWIPRMFA